MDHSWPKPDQRGVPQSAVPVGAVRQAQAPVLDRGAISGDNLHFGRLRQHTRSSHSGSQGSGAEEEWLCSPVEGAGSYGRSPIFQRMQPSEAIWYSRGTPEQADGNQYHRRVFTSSHGTHPSSSPRSPNARGAFVSHTMTFHSKRSHTQQEQEEAEGYPAHPETIVRPSGIHHRPYNKGRYRASSESDKGSQGSSGPAYRRRGHSETAFRPRWDNSNNMSGLQCLATESIWFDKHRYDQAERCFYEGVNGPAVPRHQSREASAILQDIAQSRQTIQQSLNGVKSALQQGKGHQFKRRHRNSSSNAGGDQEMLARMKSLELENQSLHKVVQEMRATLQKLESRVVVLERGPAAGGVKAAPSQQAKVENGGDDEDDFDLFGSDEDDEEADRIKQERIDAYAAKKANKPTVIAKSSIILDVKPWDDETDLVKLEECVRSVQMDGLLWGASKLVPVGYGIKKLQINCVVEDDKVGTDILEEEITKFEDYVQSVDVAAFNKI